MIFPLGASQWLNYDLFGLFVAARQVGNNGFEWEEWMDGIHRGLKLNI
jgi:hypothetical protein